MRHSDGESGKGKVQSEAGTSLQLFIAGELSSRVRRFEWIIDCVGSFMLKHAAWLLMDRSRWGTACDRGTEEHVTGFEVKEESSMHSGTFALMIRAGRNGFLQQIQPINFIVSISFNSQQDAFGDGRETFKTRLILKKPFATESTLWPRVNPKLSWNSLSKETTLCHCFKCSKCDHKTSHK